MNIFLSIIEQGMIYIPHVLGMYVSLMILKIPFLALETAYVVGAIWSAILPNFISNFSLLAIFGLMIFVGFFISSLSISLKYYLNMSYLLISILLGGIFYGLNQYIIGGTHISLQNKTELLFLSYSFKKYPQNC